MPRPKKYSDDDEFAETPIGTPPIPPEGGADTAAPMSAPDGDLSEGALSAAPQPRQGVGAATTPVVYQSRIRVMEAWRYPGVLAGAPDYIDRNWVSYAEYDPVRKLEPGPALAVPVNGVDMPPVLARVGDYVVKQEVTVIDGLSDLQLAVWPAGDFERIFMPVSQPEVHDAAA